MARRFYTTLTDVTDGYTCFLKPLVELWGRRPIAMITRDEVLDYRASVAREKSKALANRRTFVLTQVFDLAAEQGIVKSDVLGRIPSLSEKEHERKAHMRPEQVDALLDAAGRSAARSYLPLAILLAVEHGASTQEILDLKWTDVDLKRKTIRLFRTKNGVERSQRIMPRTLHALVERKAHLEAMRHRKRTSLTVVGDHVVGRLDGSRLGSIRKAWKSVCMSLDFDDLHFHDNRHTYCSNILLAGGTLKDAKEMIGHRTLRMVDRYSHLDAIRVQSMQERLAEHYRAASGGRE